MSEYLGKHVSSMLGKEPFRNWPLERSVDDDLEEVEINYVFKENGLAVCCDQSEQISVIFLYSENYKGFDETLSEVPFSWNRAQILKHLGSPSKSGEKFNDPILGQYGPWDRFTRPGFAIHIEYRPDSDRIKMIRLMRSDVVPPAVEQRN